MQDYNEFRGEFTTVIENSFDGGFQHYKNQVINTIKATGVSAPVVFVLELERNKVKGSDLTSIDIQGKSYVPDISPIRDYIKKLGLQYIKGIEQNNGAIPSAIIVCSEVWLQEKKFKKGEKIEHEPLQDKQGKGINGSVEKFMVSGMTATDKKEFALYDIIRDKKGAITDLIIDENGTALLAKGEAMILNSFYKAMAEYLKDKLKGLESWSF